MGRLGSGARVGLAWAVVLGAGCGSEQFAPPPGLKAVTTSESVAPSKTIFMVLPGPPDGDLESCALAAQQEAGIQQAIFRLVGPGPTDPPSKQGEMIRRAVGDGADALVVLANEDPDTARALAEVSEKGTAVILFGRPVAARQGKPPLILVAPEPFVITAKRLVEAAMADAVKNGRPADGEALILSTRKGDIYAADRVSALKAAAEAAKCRKVEVIPFDGLPDDAVRGIEETAKSRPDLAVILAEGDEAMELAIKVRRALKGQPLTFVGGYAGLHGQFSANPYFQESAFVEFRPDSLARLAIRTALAKASGEVVGPVMTFEPRFNRGSGSTSFSFKSSDVIPSPATGPPAAPDARVQPEK